MKALLENIKNPATRERVSNLIEKNTSLRYPDSMHLQKDIEDAIVGNLNTIDSLNPWVFAEKEFPYMVDDGTDESKVYNQHQLEKREAFVRGWKVKQVN